MTLSGTRWIWPSPARRRRGGASWPTLALIGCGLVLSLGCGHLTPTRDAVPPPVLEAEPVETSCPLGLPAGECVVVTTNDWIEVWLWGIANCIVITGDEAVCTGEKE
jgi:hypothetical protein